jgi:hypothetical protein
MKMKNDGREHDPRRALEVALPAGDHRAHVTVGGGTP